MSSKIDLKILNALVKAVNLQLSVLEKIDPVAHTTDYVVETSKTIGLLSTISSEATFLVADVARSNKQAPSSTSDDLLEKLLGDKKSPNWQ